MLSLYVHKQPVEVKITRFPAGESLVSIDDEQRIPYGEAIYAKITLNWENNDDLVNLLLLTDCIRQRYIGHDLRINLDMPYMPYARQDRVCNKGESLSVKVIANLINSQNYFSVLIRNAHSEVTPALINNCINLSMEDIASSITSICKPDNTILVSPDAGANKKVFSFAKDNKYPEVVRADKTRDVLTGKITGTKVFLDGYKPLNHPSGEIDMRTMEPFKHDTIVTDKDFLILDDICDGGYTFIQLAKELRKYTTGQIFLYVTHGLFTKDLGCLRDAGISKVYCSNIMYNKLFDKDFLVQV